MSDASLTPSRPAPASVYLLAEHLDAALAAGEDLADVLYVWPGRRRARARRSRRSARASAPPWSASKPSSWRCISRLLKAREWAAMVAMEDEQFGTVARLYQCRHRDPARRRGGMRRHAAPSTSTPATTSRPMCAAAASSRRTRRASPTPRPSQPATAFWWPGACRSACCSIWLRPSSTRSRPSSTCSSSGQERRRAGLRPARRRAHALEPRYIEEAMRPERRATVICSGRWS